MNRMDHKVGLFCISLAAAGGLLSSVPSLAEAQLPPVPVPAENPITEAKRVLGKILFWEEQLSSDDSIACGTCHIPAAAGADPRQALHPGADGTFGSNDDVLGSPGVVRRNDDGDAINDPVFGFEPQVTGRAAPSFFTTIWANATFWDGRAGSTFTDPVEGGVVIANGGSLENQAIGPILNSVEMAHDNRNWEQVSSKLETVVPMRLADNRPEDIQEAIDAAPSYPELFAAAFGDEEINPVRIAFAIATYERTLVPDQTPWDRFMAGDTNALTQNQIRGWNAFNGNNTPCDICHAPPLFTNNAFHNIGLRPADEDEGRLAVTGNNADFGDMKTPSLRNIGLRVSLMHTGTITDADDALDFYNQGNTHFTEFQDTIPQNGGSYDDININGRTRDEIADFLANGLTDPRVAAEEFPFDRPTLASELGTNVQRCSDVPMDSCRNTTTDGAARIRIEADPDDEERTRFQWKWTRGEATDAAYIGDPTNGDGFALCFYTGAEGLLDFEARAPAGGICGNSECWRRIGAETDPRGYKYSDGDLTPDGIKKIKAKTGVDGKAKITIKAQGAELLGSPLGFPELPLSLPLVVQLQSASGGCWQATYTDSDRNEAERFSSK